MDILMDLDEWNNKFKNLIEGEMAWIYRSYHGVYRDIVRDGLLPCFMNVIVDNKKHIFQIYDVKQLPTKHTPVDDRVHISGEVCHAIQLKVPSKDQEMEVFDWENECDWWFENLDSQTQMDIIGNDTLSDALNTWKALPIDKRKNVWKLIVSETKELEEELSHEAGTIEYVSTTDTNTTTNETNKITLSLLEDNEDEEDAEPEPEADLPPPPEDEDIGFTGATLSCDNCNGLVKDTDESCPHCGAEFIDEEEEEIPPPPPKKDKKKPVPKKDKKKDKKEKKEDLAYVENPDLTEFSWKELKEYAKSKGISLGRKKRAVIEEELLKLR